MAPIRTKNRFGRRYIRLRELRDYAVDLDLGPNPPDKGLMEFLEAEGLLTPVRRLRFSPEISRRFSAEAARISDNARAAADSRKCCAIFASPT